MKNLFLCICLFTWQQASHGQDSADNATRLDEHILKVEFSNHGGSSKLDFLDNIIGEKRIVFLGEASHGDGSTLELRNRIVDYLIRKKGFEVLLLELNLFEMEKMTELVRSGLDTDFIIQEAMRAEHDYSPSYFELCKSLLRHRAGWISGYDITQRSILFELLKPAISQLISSHRSIKAHEKRTIDEYFDLINVLQAYERVVFSDVTLDLDVIETKTDQVLELISLCPNSNDRELLQQVVRGNLWLAKWIHHRIPLDENDSSTNGLFLQHELRDKFMAENLVWLLEKRFRGKKVIVTGATYHISPVKGIGKPMASYLPDSIRKQSAFFPFIYYQGRPGVVYSDQKEESLRYFRRPALSLEYLLHQTRKSPSFLSMKDTFVATVCDTMPIYLSGGLPKISKWSAVYDGIFFIDEMKPNILKHISTENFRYIQHNLMRRVK